MMLKTAGCLLSLVGNKEKNPVISETPKAPRSSSQGQSIGTELGSGSPFGNCGSVALAPLRLCCAAMGSAAVGMMGEVELSVTFLLMEHQC